MGVRGLMLRNLLRHKMSIRPAALNAHLIHAKISCLEIWQGRVQEEPTACDGGGCRSGRYHVATDGLMKKGLPASETPLR